jgi:shikimate kinase
LVGYRGTGKTAVSQYLAEELGFHRLGMDETLVDRFGTGIPEFVARNGWDAFRDAESELVREISSRDRQVIDSGGGVVVRGENTEALRENGRVVWLTATVETIAERIGGDSQRPSLTGAKSFVDEIEEVLRERVPLYRQASDLEVETDDLSAEDVAQRILNWWKDLG